MVYIASERFYSEYISHHGVKGQHWGIRNGPPYPLYKSIKSLSSNNIFKNERFKSFKISNSEKSIANEEWNRQKGIKLGANEHAKVVSALNRKLSSKSDVRAIEYVASGNYNYRVIVKDYGEYKVLDKARIAGTKPANNDELIDDILSEVVGPDWRYYDE